MGDEINKNDEGDWIFGVHAVDGAIEKMPDRIVQVVISKQSRNQRVQLVIDHAQSLGIDLRYENVQVLDRQVKGRHQGVIACVRSESYKTEQQLKKDIQQWSLPLVLVLDSIEDPRNLGACLRSADAAAVTAVVMTKNKSAPITAVTRKTAAGAVDSLTIYQVNNLARVLSIMKEQGIWVYGTDCSSDSVSLYRADLTGGVAIVMGNEGKGLRHLVKQSCDHLVHIPMTGSIQSLNVSVATGVTLFEAVRQRSLAS